jgi:hypothetical protein
LCCDLRFLFFVVCVTRPIFHRMTDGGRLVGVICV